MVTSGVLFDEDVELDEDEEANMNCRLSEMSDDEKTKYRKDVKDCAENRLKLIQEQQEASRRRKRNTDILSMLTSCSY